MFLFYPGDYGYFKIFAYNRDLFDQKQIATNYLENPLPILRFNYYPQITATGAYIVDLPSFTPVFEKNSQEKLFPASTAKVITSLVAVDIYNPDEVITIKQVHDVGQVMGLLSGERITVENLLYGLLVHSGNDAAYALADNYGFSKFIDLMNQKAKDLNMKNTHLTNPAGLDDYSEYTTAYDLTLAARELLHNNMLRKIVATKEITIADADFRYFHRLTNVNQLLGEIQGIGGLKTGYTENAKENLISFYKKDGHQFIITILKSDDRFADTREIVSWIDANIDYLNLHLIR